ncbi:MAG TPA: outer membrane protein assembly factor BamE [Burkholderiales bacterium]|nr:outer membrane protein assembly factor BamE [Burkholderiales bacterium]
MKTISALVLALALTGCAGFSGWGLVPGQSSAEEVEALMGPAADTRQGPGGDTVRYYSRLPYGREMYAARIGSDGKLRAIEQRLTDENVAKLRLGVSRADDVRDLIGPPYRVDTFRRLEREVWTYKMYGGGTWPKDLYVQFSRDGIVREVMVMDDPQYSAIAQR